MSNAELGSILKLAWPLIVLQLGLQIYLIIDLLKKQKTKTLSMPVWVVIVIIFGTLGSILYLLVGRKEE